MLAFRIIRRAHSGYTPVENFVGTYADASERAAALHRANPGGEYFPRFPNEPDAIPSGAQQSGLDWI